VVVEEKPYIEHKLSNGMLLRTFSKDALIEELVWHRDHHDRIVEVVEGEGWEIQFDNKLPQPLKVGNQYNIPANTYHRVKRGTTDLVIKIKEM
jgi:quercetin dioxygenase-like cupin family protein